MDTYQQTFAKISRINHPAHLWIGAHQVVNEVAHRYLQKLWCSENSCGLCITCTQIVAHQHHNLVWLEPEKGYTLDLIDLISSKLRYTLDHDQSFFFILARADTLTTACSNRLLKILEEPAPGYHFILLAHRTDTILPTIKSRLILHEWYDTDAQETTHKLFSYFTAKKAPNTLEFLSFLEATPISEYQSMQMLDQLFIYWTSAYKKSLNQQNPMVRNTIEKNITHLSSGISRPPMPGSTKLFWKNLFLQMYG